MVSTPVRTPDAANLYVGAYPELPESIDTSGMLELNNSFDARPYDGSVCVWDGDDSTYNARRAADRDLESA